MSHDVQLGPPIPAQGASKTRGEVLLDLGGARLEHQGRNYIVVSGQVSSFDASTGEALGHLSIISNARPNTLNGAIILKVHRLEFVITMMQSKKADMPGEQSMRFAARLIPNDAVTGRAAPANAGRD